MDGDRSADNAIVELELVQAPCHEKMNAGGGVGGVGERESQRAGESTPEKRWGSEEKFLFRTRNRRDRVRDQFLGDGKSTLCRKGIG